MMKRLQRDALLLYLIEALKSRKSWCGETHLQKATYFLQELLGVPLGFKFILYKYGPFSFDLRDEITAMRADNMLIYKIQPEPYGPSIVPGESFQTIKERFPITLEKYSKQVEFIANIFGNKGVSELERLATALYVTLEHDIAETDRSHKVNELKPHISIEEAQEAIDEVDNIIKTSKIL